MKSTYRESFGVLYDPKDVNQSVQQIVEEVMSEVYPSEKSRTIYAILSTIAAALTALPVGKVSSFLVSKIGAKAAATRIGSFLIKAQGAGWLARLNSHLSKSDIAWISLGLASDLSVLENYDRIKDGKFQIQKWMNPKSLIDFLEIATIDDNLLSSEKVIESQLFAPVGEKGYAGDLDLYRHVIPAAWYADCVHLAAERLLSRTRAQGTVNLEALKASVVRARFYRLLVQMWEQELPLISFNSTENHLAENVVVGGLSEYGVEALNAIIVYAEEARKVLGEVGHETVCSLIAASAHRAVSRKAGALKKMTSYLVSRGVDVLLLGEDDE